MARKVNAETLDHIKRFEGLRLTAYPDPGSRDGTPWTIGYGSTTGVRKGMTITQAEADRRLVADLATAEAAVDRLVKVPLTDNQFGALVSFTFNVGVGAFECSTLLKKLNAQQYDAVPAELARWNKNDGKVMQGLTNRRAAEAGLWAKGAFVSSNTVEAKPAAPGIDRETLGWGAGILGSLGTLFAGTGPVQWAFAAILIVGFLVGGYLFLSKRVAPK